MSYNFQSRKQILTLRGVYLFELGYGRERSKNMMSRSLRSGFGFVRGYVKQNCYGLRIFNFQPPQQCPVIVNQRQGVAQGDVDLHQGGGVIKRAKSFSRPRSISPNPLRCFIPHLVRRVREPHQHLLTDQCHREDLLWVVQWALSKGTRWTSQGLGLRSNCWLRKHISFCWGTSMSF